MASNQLEQYRHGGARAMVLLHERHVRLFVATWRTAKSSGALLPETEDPSYTSLEALLAHVLHAAGGYMTRICKSLDLPDPGINPVPAAGEIQQLTEDYLDHLFERWRLPLCEVPPEGYRQSVSTPKWGLGGSVESILEHAVMHPIRHEFQLANILEQQGLS